MNAQAMENLAGWYEVDGRRVLVTHVPEPDFGEPMVLVGDGDRILRAVRSGDELSLGDSRVLRLSTLSRDRTFVEEEVEFAADGARLLGTLIAPPTTGPPAAVVLVHGAGGGQRDFSRLLAQRFLEAGVATLIYDKAGHGRSGGPADPTIYDQAAAADAALDLLSTHAAVDSTRVGLSGFSNGMWSVPIVAARRSDVAFVHGVGSPGVTMAASEIHRRTTALREAGVPEATLEAVATAWGCVFTIIGEGRASESTSTMLEAALVRIDEDEVIGGYDLPAFARQNPMLSPVPPRASAADVVAMVAGVPSPEVLHDPTDDYRSIDCPVLLQYGACDSNVPVGRSVDAISAALRDAGNEQATIAVYPGMEHMLNVAVTPAPGRSAEEVTYTFEDFRFGAVGWPSLASWLHGRGLAGG